MDRDREETIKQLLESRLRGINESIEKCSALCESYRSRHVVSK